MKKPKRSQAQIEAFARLTGRSVDEVTNRPTKRVVTLWERCHVCALQMVKGPRCLEHNPYPADDRSYVIPVQS